MDSTRCLYASKPCSNTRSYKGDGQLHRLCRFHRDKANAAQRRWHRRRGSSPTAKMTKSSTTTTSPALIVGSAELDDRDMAELDAFLEDFDNSHLIIDLPVFDFSLSRYFSQPEWMKSETHVIDVSLL